MKDIFMSESKTYKNMNIIKLKGGEGKMEEWREKVGGQKE